MSVTFTQYIQAIDDTLDKNMPSLAGYPRFERTITWDDDAVYVRWLVLRKVRIELQFEIFIEDILEGIKDRIVPDDQYVSAYVNRYPYTDLKLPEEDVFDFIVSHDWGQYMYDVGRLNG